MSTHNISVRREIRKILCGYPLLSVAMIKWHMQMVYPQIRLLFQEQSDQGLHSLPVHKVFLKKNSG